MERMHMCRIRRVTPVFLGLLGMATLLFVGPTEAQSQGRSSAAAPKAPPATLAQLMRGTLFPESNVIFAAQGEDPAKIPPAADPSTAVNPLASTYGKWQAVENAALAMSEVANLLMVPGRKCSNGIDVPIKNADWAKWVQGLKDVGASTYKAAQSKDQDKVLDAAGDLAQACANCHDKYREKPNLADRCK
jgi:hypothetical protein